MSRADTPPNALEAGVTKAGPARTPARRTNGHRKRRVPRPLSVVPDSLLSCHPASPTPGS